MVQNASSAVEFPPASAEDWRALVLKTLGDKPPESLTTTTADGLTIAPLYGAGLDGAVPTRPFDADRAWDLRAATRHPDPARANADILADLEGGAASVLVAIDPSAQSGVAVGATEDLARVLDGVILELAPVALDAGFLGTQAADWLSGVAKASPTALLQFHLDPLSAFARTGQSPGPIEAHLFACAGAAARHAVTYPKAQLFLASGAVVHEAGGGAACEVAFAAASALAYAKAMVRAGMAMDQAFSRITLGVAAEADYFLTIAKLRAARLVWARLVGACGLDVPARIEARSSQRMLTRRDPWTNMLRLTSAGFGAAVGGADAIILGAFTDALGRPSPLARRQSRNTQLVLMEEAHIGRVAAPAPRLPGPDGRCPPLSPLRISDPFEIDAAR